MASAEPRKHHYVQAAHIRLFANRDGKVWAYTKDGSKFPTSPLGIFAQKDLNSFLVDGKLNTEFETVISKVEDSCWPAVKRLSERGTLDQADIEALCCYMALSRARNPTTQSFMIEQHKKVIETTTRMLDRSGRFDDLGSMPGQSGKSVSELMDDGIIGVKVNNSKYIENFKHVFEASFGLLLRGFRWSLVFSEHQRALLSDHPLTFVHPGEDFGAYGIPFGGTGCEIAFPVCPRFYLLGSWEKCVCDLHSENAIDELNKRQAIFASRFLASPYDRKWIAKLAARFRDWSFETRTEALDFGDGAYLISRGKVFRSLLSKSLGTKNPLLATKPVLSC